jgi:hypothetical protein
VERCQDNHTGKVLEEFLQDIETEFDFAGIQASDFQRILMAAEERDVTLEDVETWLEESGGDTGYQVLTPEEITFEILVWDKEDDVSDEEEVPRKKPKMSDVREWIDNLINYVDKSDNKRV